MKTTRQLPTQPRRDAWVGVDLGAIEHNAKALRALISPDKQLMAILKADAYGHGAVMILPTLEASGISMIGVASIDEALQFRRAGIELPVLVIGVAPDWAIPAAIEQDIQLTIFTEQHLDSLRQVYQQTGKPISIQIKVDTGMHRIGVDYKEAPKFIHHCQEQPFVKVMGVFSHFASTHDDAASRRQLVRWDKVLAAIEPSPQYVHICNSAGAIQYPDAAGNLVRLGIGLFGYDPEGTLADQVTAKLKPAMALKARIIRIHEAPEGEGVSYGHTYQVGEKIARIATLPLGYADGIPRVLSNKIEGLLHGQRVRQVGTITMDQLMMDVTNIPNAQVGETITLIGEEGGDSITLSDWAKKAGTIEYELMCGLRVRLPKTYTRD